MSVGQGPPTGENRFGLPAGWTLHLAASIAIGLLVAAVVPRLPTFALSFETPSTAVPLAFDLALESQAVAATRIDGSVVAETPTPNQVRLTVAPRHPLDPASLGETLRQALDERFTALAARLRAEPTQAEAILTQQVALHRTRVEEAQRKLDDATAALPPDDPRVDREALRLRWDALRADWSSTSGAAQQAAAEIERLRATPDLAAGVVSPEDRRVALTADPALQQDLEELNVRLTEMKLHLLNVWQISAGRLEQLVKEASAFQELLANLDTSELSTAVKKGIEELRVQLDAYVVTLAAFENAWTVEFTAIQRREIDPERPEILDIQERMRKLLNDFLFAGSRQLGELRASLGESDRTPSASARHYVLESNLTRGFQTVQSSHHRFEFAASTIETPENFRLDAALRSARGLHRRVREQIAVIEKDLETKAAERARTQRLEALAQAEKTIAELRVASQRTVTELFNVQDGLLSAGTMTEAFLLAALRVEVIAQSVQVMQRDLADLEAHRAKLEADRLALADKLHATLVSSELIARDYQWGLRLRLAAVTALLVGLVLALVPGRESDRPAAPA